MQTTLPGEDLFPELARFVERTGVLDKARGNLSAVLPRILGQGTSRATGLDFPPSAIERQIELAGLDLGPSVAIPPEVRLEIDQAAAAVDRLRAEFNREDGVRRFHAACLERLDVQRGQKDGYWYAGGMLLIQAKKNLEWSWSVTPHYSIVAKLPPDPDFVARAFHAAREKVQSLTLPPDAFEKKLRMAWLLARQSSESDDVPVVDVMKMFQVAGQDDRFWLSPRRQFYKDLPEAAFPINLINWRASGTGGAFEFVPATLHQTKPGRVFYMPMNREGTEVRPMIYLRSRTKE